MGTDDEVEYAAADWADWLNRRSVTDITRPFPTARMQAVYHHAQHRAEHKLSNHEVSGPAGVPLCLSSGWAGRRRVAIGGSGK